MLDKTILLVETVPHQLSQALWVCNDIYTLCSNVIDDFNLPNHLLSSFYSSDTGLYRLTYIINREQVINWLSTFKKMVIELLSSMQSNKTDSLEKAREYVQNNISKHIVLQDVANYVCISPSYLSAMFKKHYNQSLFDFINELKIELACTQMLEGNLKIYEIAYSLGYENAYYFTKVFKKYKGLTPTEYQYKLKKEKRVK